MKFKERIKWFSKDSYKIISMMLILQIICALIRILFNNPFLLLSLIISPQVLLLILQIIIVLVFTINLVGAIWFLILILKYKKNNSDYKFLFKMAIASLVIQAINFISVIWNISISPYAITSFLTIIDLVNLVVLFFIWKKLKVNSDIFL